MSSLPSLLEQNFGTLSALIKSAALVCAMGVILFGYRALLFFTSYWATMQ